MIDRKPLAYAWFQRIHTELKSKATFDQFMNTLRLNSYGDDYISIDDFEEWIQSKGEMLNISANVGNSVRLAIVAKFASNQNAIPTRKSIDSAFLNLAGTSWTYFDVAKTTSLDVMKTGKMITDAAGKLTYAASSVATNAMDLFSNKWIFYVGAAFTAYLIWMNKDSIGKAFSGGLIDIGSSAKKRTMNAAGKLADKAQAKMKLNPSKKKKYKYRRKVA